MGYLEKLIAKSKQERIKRNAIPRKTKIQVKTEQAERLLHEGNKLVYVSTVTGLHEQKVVRIKKAIGLVMQPKRINVTELYRLFDYGMKPKEISSKMSISSFSISKYYQKYKALKTLNPCLTSQSTQ